MRIAFVAQPFDRMEPPVRDGSLAMWIYYMAGRCAQRGHEAVVFGAHGNTFSAGSARSDNVRYIFTPTGLDRLLNKASRVFSSRRKAAAGVPDFASPWHHLGYAVEVARRARRLGCDVVHVMNYSQFVPVIRKLHPRCKINLHMQCEWLTQLDRGLVEKRLRHADLIVGCSEYITRKIAGKFPEYADRCKTVPNAADVVPDRSGTLPQGKAVIFVGRLSPEKGIHDLIRAFHQVLQRFPDARLHLVGGIGTVPLNLLVGLSDEPQVAALRVFYQSKGDGAKDPYLAILEREAGQELGKRIIFEGRADHDQIAAHYRRATVLVNPSLSESFGISLVEAMMHCVPVVATRIGGMSFTVDHGRTGFLVEPANPPALAEAICAVFSDLELARRMGEAGRARAMETFSWEKTTEVLLDHCRALLN